ncbi:putative Tau-tubulin kinase [Blattamonas nauphoetae]|uniref:non-specific serine/threonine protein kinase n=1 Tax=Blattamonas nauphoetae TaxID=2049346 RepID=A0ABQ9XC82_9EUKA|nr:putative Tau-tubulin kinase [Blattamonas nauphoetae]
MEQGVVETIPLGDDPNLNLYVYELIGKGGFGRIHHCKFKDLHLALKREPKSQKIGSLKKEIEVLRACQGMPHFPKVYHYGSLPEDYFVTMELLGRNLSSLVRKQPKNVFSPVTTALIGLHSLEAIELLHSKGYLHYDIKPSNLVIGRNSRRNFIYLIDFGLSRRFFPVDEQTEQGTRGFRGTARYASISAHCGQELGRVDDLWSWFYVLIDLSTGKLPWAGDVDKSVIARKKQQSKNHSLIVGMPKQYRKILDLLTSLTCYDQPNYSLFKQCLISVLESNSSLTQASFDWNPNEKIDPSAWNFLDNSVSQLAQKNMKELIIQAPEVEVQQITPLTPSQFSPQQPNQTTILFDDITDHIPILSPARVFTPLDQPNVPQMTPTQLRETLVDVPVDCQGILEEDLSTGSQPFPCPTSPSQSGFRTQLEPTSPNFTQSPSTHNILHRLSRNYLNVGDESPLSSSYPRMDSSPFSTRLLAGTHQTSMLSLFQRQLSAQCLSPISPGDFSILGGEHYFSIDQVDNAEGTDTACPTVFIANTPTGFYSRIYAFPTQPTGPIAHGSLHITHHDESTPTNTETESVDIHEEEQHSALTSPKNTPMSPAMQVGNPPFCLSPPKIVISKPPTLNISHNSPRSPAELSNPFTNPQEPICSPNPTQSSITAAARRHTHTNSIPFEILPVSSLYTYVGSPTATSITTSHQRTASQPVFPQTKKQIFHRPSPSNLSQDPDSSSFLLHNATNWLGTQQFPSSLSSNHPISPGSTPRLLRLTDSNPVPFSQELPHDTFIDCDVAFVHHPLASPTKLRHPTTELSPPVPLRDTSTDSVRGMETESCCVIL